MCSAPKMPAVPNPPPPPQAEASPSPDVFKRSNQQQAGKGYSSTLLTGASGIDPKAQSVGYNTLLGR
jgi:hypothetical protein